MVGLSSLKPLSVSEPSLKFLSFWFNVCRSTFGYLMVCFCLLSPCLLSSSLLSPTLHVSVSPFSSWILQIDLWLLNGGLLVCGALVLQDVPQGIPGALFPHPPAFVSAP